MEYTKGEWKVERIAGRLEITANKNSLATPWLNATKGYSSTKELEANAHLIASAPDLYEAGKAVKEAVGRSLRATVSYSATLDVLQIAIDRLAKALAKAEVK